MSREQVLGRLGLMEAERGVTAARLMLSTLQKRVTGIRKERDSEVAAALAGLSDEEILGDPDLLEFFLREAEVSRETFKRAEALTFCHRDVPVWWGFQPGTGWAKVTLSLQVKQGSDGMEQSEAIRSWWRKFAMGRDVLPSMSVITADTGNYGWEVEVTNPDVEGWFAIVTNTFDLHVGSLESAVAFVGKHAWGY